MDRKVLGPKDSGIECWKGMVVTDRVLCYTVVSVLVLGIGIARGQYYWILDIGCLAWYHSNPSENERMNDVVIAVIYNIIHAVVFIVFAVLLFYSHVFITVVQCLQHNKGTQYPCQHR